MIRLIKKFALILNRRRKIQVFGIIFLMFIAGLLETLGVSLMVPLISAILSDDFIETNKIVGTIAQVLDIKNSQEFIIFLLIALIIVYVVKNLFLFFECCIQVKFTCNTRFETQANLMHAYLTRPYEDYLDIGLGEVIKVITGDVNGTFALLQVLMTLSAEMIVSAMLVVTIFVVDFVMAMVAVIVLGITMLLIYKGIKPFLRKAAQIYSVNATLSNKWMLQSINGIKEIKVANKESFFLKQYMKYAQRTVSSEKKNSVVENTPRLLIEMIVVSGMLGMVIVMIHLGYSVEDLFPKLSACAVVAVRLLPSANRISNAMNAMAFREINLDNLIKNMTYFEKERNISKKIESKEKVETKQEYMLKTGCGLKNIFFQYPHSDVNVLEDVTMEIPKGSCVGIVGKSGEGKTTAIDILLGLLAPQAGEVLVDDLNIEQDRAGWLKCLSYIPQKIFMLDDTIKANVAFGIEESEIDIQEVWRALKEACLDEFVKGLPDGLNTTIGEAGIRLSGGQRQRIGIARALYSNPQLLIFDEATSSLDNETEAAIMESINALHGNKTMIIIAHRLTTISGCDIVYRVADKKIVREK